MLFTSRFVKFIKIDFFQNKTASKWKRRIKANLEKLSERLPENHRDGHPAKRDSDPVVPNEEIGPPIKEILITDHPHREEILD